MYKGKKQERTVSIWRRMNEEFGGEEVQDPE